MSLATSTAALDLLEHLLAKIHADLQQRPARKTLVVFVGDLIDRGPSSAQVIERLRSYRRAGVQPVFLLGNHEEVLLRIIAGDFSAIDQLAAVRRPAVPAKLWRRARAASRTFRGRSGRDRAQGRSRTSMSNSSTPSSIAAGSATICSSTPASGPESMLDQQSQADLRWIRDPFLFDESDHGFVVVHGHTISEEVDERPNRIGIDTGAYRIRHPHGAGDRRRRPLADRHARRVSRRSTRCRLI